MNSAKLPSIILAMLLVSSLDARTQNQLQFAFRGICYQTDSTGQTIGRPVNEKTLLREFAQTAAIMDSRSLILAYHVGGNELGDTVEVVNSKTGQVLATLFGFYFGQSFGRMALTNAPGTVELHLDYVYTRQNSHSLGTALATKRYWVDRKGTSHTTIQGQMDYLITSEGTKGVRVCSGRFAAGRPLKFVNTP